MCTLGGERWGKGGGGHRGTGKCPSLPCKCQFSHTGGKPIILQKKKKKKRVYYLLKCFTDNVTQYLQKGETFVHKKIINRNA